MLITCPECEEIVSNRAEYCPHCGCPNKYLIEVEPFDSYIIGKKVKHKKYGEGIVVSFADGIMEIEFEGNGIKKFTLDSFVNFCTSDIKTTNKILNEIKIGTIEAKIADLIENKKIEQEESFATLDGYVPIDLEDWDLPDWSNVPAGHCDSNESELDYYESDEDDLYENDEDDIDSISDSYAYYYGDDEIL